MDASPSSIRDNLVIQCVVILAVVCVLGCIVMILVDVMTGILTVGVVAVILGFVMLEADQD